MSQPSGQEVRVATESLRAEASLWLQQSDQMDAIHHKAEAQHLGRLEAGLFQLVVSSYDEMVDQVANRCREGQQRMTEIAETLRRVADIYDDEDMKNAHRFVH